MSWFERHPSEGGITRFTTVDGSRYSLARGAEASLSQWFARYELAFLGLSICIGGHRAAAQDTDFAPYARAADYRGDLARPIALSQDKRILCLDGSIVSDLNVSAAADWRTRASPSFVAVEVPPRAQSNWRMCSGRNAAVVVRGFCLFTCASFILFCFVRGLRPG
ncbi:hypothetical protein ACQ86E_04220 [Bradyrhizobium betae]|uniref:hypothetical protein n=1 Tax=Bradyrhizobium betae TaxID=244734 RepID=UPI003D67D994